MIRLETARPIDSDFLRALLWENSMAYVDPVEHFILAKEGDRILGCARLEHHLHLTIIRPLVVAQRFRGQGVGRVLLEAIMHREKPTIVVSRGATVDFYRKSGFSVCPWHLIPMNQQEECSACDDRETCKPHPMIYLVGGKYPTEMVSYPHRKNEL